MIPQYKARVEKELKAKCDEVLTLLKESLIPQYKGKANESEVFYLKMAADYYRYLAEFESGDDSAKQAENFYQKALDVATEALNETHPTRLGLALNFSVCY